MAAVWADSMKRVTTAIGFSAIAMDVNTLGDASLAIVNKYIITVIVYGNQVPSIRFKRNRLAIGTDLGSATASIGFGTVTMDTDTFSGTGLPVMDKDVGLAVGISVHQIRHTRAISHVSTILTAGNIIQRGGMKIIGLELS